MRFGTVCMWRDEVEPYRERVRYAEEVGFEVVANGDSQSVYRDLYVGLAVAAEATDRALIGPMVTNALTRHPAVAASAIHAVDSLSGHRAIFGFGSGDSAVRNIGLAPARLVEMESYLKAFRELQREGTTTWQGATVKVQNLSREIPIWMTAEGPRTLQLAGALADVVVLHSGTADEAVRWAIDNLHQGAVAAGRDPEAIEVWMMLKTSLADTRDEAIAGVKMGLAGSAHHAYHYSIEQKGVPTDLIGPIQELIRRYDPTDHEIHYGRNADLSDELGVTDFLADAFGLIGTAEECRAKLQRLERVGVHGVILPAIGPDPMDLIHRVGRDLIPALAPAASGVGTA